MAFQVLAVRIQRALVKLRLVAVEVVRQVQMVVMEEMAAAVVV
jgi:hypothetical protein